MKILLIFRKKEDVVGKFVTSLKEKLIKKGNKVDILSREDDLNLPTLSSSMGSLKESIKKKDAKENYDKIYTFDWSIAFPLLFPSKILNEKHYCLFYDLEPSKGQSKILQKITANMLGDHLLVRTKKLKEKFPRSELFKEDLSNF